MNKPLDPLLIAKIEQVTIDKAANGEMFTAFDVSRTVQSMGNRERHNNMKQHCHAVFESGQLAGYDRTLVAVNAGNPDAWVYHPTGSDATTYKPTFQPLPTGMTAGAFYGTPPVVPTGNPSLTSVRFSPTAAVNGKHLPDARGAITVPAKLIHQIGGKPGDILDVEKDGDALVISTAGNGRKYTVNTSLNIRIKRKTWGQIATGNGQFEFEEKSGKIVVTHK